MGWSKGKEVRVYSAQADRTHVFAVVAELCRELRDNRWLIWQLAKRDFVAAYKQHILGFVWALVVPLVSLSAFVVLRRAGVLVADTGAVAYPVYVLAGLICWQLFSNGLTVGTGALVNSGGMLSKVNLSKKSLVVAAYCQVWVAFAIQMALMAVMCSFLRAPFSISVIWLPLALIPLVVFTLALSFVLSVLNAVMRDFGSAVTLALGFYLLLTPVFYRLPERGILAAFNRYNPMFYFVEIPRSLIVSGGVSSHWAGYFVSTGAVCALFIGSLVIFHIAETKISERM